MLIFKPIKPKLLLKECAVVEHPDYQKLTQNFALICTACLTCQIIFFFSGRRALDFGTLLMAKVDRYRGQYTDVHEINPQRRNE